jgi:trk system potassium uptake protein TrkA
VAVGELPMPAGTLLISVLHRRVGRVATPDTVLEAGDQVVVVAEPGQESVLMGIFARE